MISFVKDQLVRTSTVKEVKGADELVQLCCIHFRIEKLNIAIASLEEHKPLFFLDSARHCSYHNVICSCHMSSN